MSLEFLQIRSILGGRRRGDLVHRLRHLRCSLKGVGRWNFGIGLKRRTLTFTTEEDGISKREYGTKDGSENGI